MDIRRWTLYKPKLMALQTHSGTHSNKLRPRIVLSILLFAWGTITCSNIEFSPATDISSSSDATNVVVPTIITSTPQPILLPPQGLYDSCVPVDLSCLDHLNVLAEKGFKLILNYGQLYGNLKAQIAYADHAQLLGMRVIWNISYRAGQSDSWMISKYSELSSESHCEDNYCLISYFVNGVKYHPATWGYYVADEVHPEEYANMKRWTDLIKQLDPNHPRLFITAGSNDPMEQYYGFYSYMRDVADVVGPDYYPYGYIDSGNTLSRFTGSTANHAQYWADKLNMQSAIVLQAFSLSRYSTVPLCMIWPMCAPFPSYEQMKEQRDQALLNARPALILWWTYADILKTDDPERHLADLAKAAFSPVPAASPPIPEIVGDCPNGWHCEDIGNPKLMGTQVINNGTWTLQGAGWDIWAKRWVRADQFHFVWQKLDGDKKLSARIVSQTHTDPSAKAGIMVRKSVDPVSPYYAVYLTPDTGVHVQYRQDYGKESQDLSSVSLTAPVYLSVTRRGITYSTYISTDGVSWALLPNSEINLGQLSGTLMAGLAITSRNEGSLGSAVVEDVRFP